MSYRVFHHKKIINSNALYSPSVLVLELGFWIFGCFLVCMLCIWRLPSPLIFQWRLFVWFYLVNYHDQYFPLESQTRLGLWPSFSCTLDFLDSPLSWTFWTLPFPGLWTFWTFPSRLDFLDLLLHFSLLLLYLHYHYLLSDYSYMTNITYRHCSFLLICLFHFFISYASTSI